MTDAPPSSSASPGSLDERLARLEASLPPPGAHVEDEPDGALDALMRKVFGRSYRTSLAGVASIVVTLLGVLPGVPHQVAEAARVAGPVILGGGLMVAKDTRVTGATTRKR